MPPRPLEDLLPHAVERLEHLLTLVAGGARTHGELTVSTVYDAATNRFTFPTPQRHWRVVAEEDVFWVDSATDDADAQTRLTTPGQRGFLREGDRLEITLATGITRLDFLARDTAGAVFLTGVA